MASTTTQSYYNIDIPNDVIDRIILCLPAKSLLRFKYVCKYWFNLISDHNFVKTHAIHHSRSSSSSRTNPFQTHQIVVEPLVLLSRPLDAAAVRSGGVGTVRSGVVLHRLQYCSTSTSSSIDGCNGEIGNHHASSESVEVGCPFDSNFVYYYEILGSCNGLVCFWLFTHWNSRNPTEFSAWNPCTGEFKMFDNPRPINSVTYGYSSSYGFGYDYSIDDYKLVCNAYKGNNDRFELFAIQVYTLGTNSWKNIDHVDAYKFYTSRRRSKDHGIFANGGGLYWIVKDSQSKQKIIICFDIKTETYREVSKPWTPPDDVFMNIMNLGVLDGCLCMTGRDVNKKYCVNVWMMKTKMNIDTDGGGTGTGRVKEEGEYYSWIRYFTITTPVIAFPGLKRLKPLRRFCHEEHNGDHHVLMMKVQNDKKIIVSYDPKLDKATYPSWCSDAMSSMSVTETTYIESLVSLKSGIYTRHRSGSTEAEAVAAAEIEWKRKRKRKRTPIRRIEEDEDED